MTVSILTTRHPTVPDADAVIMRGNQVPYWDYYAKAYDAAARNNLSNVVVVDFDSVEAAAQHTGFHESQFVKA